MELSSDQTLADRDRQFADWGEPIVFREVTQMYAPETQQVQESFVDTELVAMIGSGGSQPSPGTGGMHLSDEMTFLVKAEELPTGSPTPTNRVVYAGVEYDVLSFSLSSRNLVYTLFCRRKA